MAPKYSGQKLTKNRPVSKDNELSQIGENGRNVVLSVPSTEGERSLSLDGCRPNGAAPQLVYFIVFNGRKASHWRAFPKFWWESNNIGGEPTAASTPLQPERAVMFFLSGAADADFGGACQKHGGTAAQRDRPLTATSGDDDASTRTRL